MSDRPWMKFYPRDWRGDQALRVVSLAARGLWMEMLCVMHEASPYGHLLIGAQPVEDAVLARLAGTSVEEVQALLVELQAANVYRRTRAGVIYSKRMVADHKRSNEGRKAKKSAIAQTNENTEENPGPSRAPSRVASTQKPESREQSSSSVVPSNEETTDGEPSHEDPNQAAWRMAVLVLRSQGGLSDRQARAFFGRLVSAHGLEARDLLGALGEAVANQTGDPQAYLTKAAFGRARRKGGAAPQKRVAFV